MVRHGAMMKSAFQRLRAIFLTGLLVTLPLGVTVWLVVYLASVVDSIVSFISPFLKGYGWLDVIASVIPSFLLTETGLPRGLGVITVIVTVLLAGVLARSYVGRWLIGLYEFILSRVPVASSVYSAVKELLELLFNQDGNAFDAVVVVEWPRKGCFALGFLNGKSAFHADDGAEMLNVFLPTTPNPTTGFYAVMHASEVIHTELTIEQGFKLLMSAGLVAPDNEPLRGITLPVYQPDSGA